MRLRIARRWFTAKSTIGQWYVDEVYQCDSLEDTVRPDPDPATPANEGKVYGETAIPARRYRIVLEKPQRVIWSPRNGKDLPEADGKLPHLLDVPGYTGIYVHAFNEPRETLGCIGTGTREPGRPDWIGGSRTALTALMRKVVEGLKAGDVWLDIEEFGRPPEGRA